MQRFCNAALTATLDPNPAQEVKRLIMNAGYAPRTVANYRSGWLAFTNWCHMVGLDPLSTTPQDCVDFISWCIAAGFRLETIYVRLKAINHYCRMAEAHPPYDDSVRKFLRHAKRVLCEKPQGKHAITPAQLLKLSQAFKETDTLLDIRDRSMILLCFALGWRRSELVSLDLRDLRWMEHGLVLRLGKSKTDQEGVGRSVGVHFGRNELTCPLRALREWLAKRGEWNGPLFTRLYPSGYVSRERLDGDNVRVAVKRGLERIGEDSAPYGAHSLRAGMITAAAEAGATETSIMQRTGHRCYETLKRYIRPATVFRADPLAGVL